MASLKQAQNLRSKGQQASHNYLNDKMQCKKSSLRQNQQHFKTKLVLQINRVDLNKKQLKIMTSEPITTIFNYNSDGETQRRQDTNQTNEILAGDEEMTITQKRESNKRQRPDSNSDLISPLYKTRNIENLNNSTPEKSIFTTPHSGNESFEIDPFKEAYLKCCDESIKHCIDNTLTCKCNLRYYKCKCGWRLYETHLPLYQWDSCDTVIAKCPYCETLNKKRAAEKYEIECKKCQIFFYLKHFDDLICVIAPTVNRLVDQLL